MSAEPYRIPVVRPVCAKCVHRRDARMMEEAEPWRDWRCDVHDGASWPAQYNPITGETTPGWVARALCRDVNADEQCQKFEALGPASDHPDYSEMGIGPDDAERFESVTSGDEQVSLWRRLWRRMFGGPRS